MKSLTFVLVIGIAICFCTPAQAQKAHRAHRIQKILDQTIETKDFATPMSLKDSLSLIYEKFAARGEDFPVIIDIAAFKEVSAEVKDPYDTMISLPVIPAKMKVASALNILLSKIELPDSYATYLVKDNCLFITTTHAARIQSLLNASIRANFEERPLREALNQLTQQTGAAIIFDRRINESLNTPVTADFRNNSTLKDAVFTLTDMANLKYTVLRNSIYITSPENVLVIDEEFKRQKAREDRDVYNPPARREAVAVP